MNPFGKNWKKLFLRAIKKAYKGGRISRNSYYELREIANE